MGPTAGAPARPEAGARVPLPAGMRVLRAPLPVGVRVSLAVLAGGGVR
ncbi:hypothetical protein CLV70_11344 [Pseudosporangium ferrugineum]|uniref:Uncharacterized protein n=1 Tax=Pseudosporangium ferrugineum TaxID=439699 RepID=A0A2T0RTU0_9ACTN|nr:hypothetical protein CLV70_11344 [Pseudosporangium ferrugineum]